MSEQLYRRIAMPPEPWSHEDNPEWIFVESHPEPYMLVPVECDYKAAAKVCAEISGTDFDDIGGMAWRADDAKRIVDAALGDTE